MINLKFLHTLKVGDIVEARFTNIAGWFRFPARITKINDNTVRVVRSDGKSVWDNESPDREFVIPKFKSYNNGIFEIEKEIENEDAYLLNMGAD